MITDSLIKGEYIDRQSLNVRAGTHWDRLLAEIKWEGILL